MPSLEEQLQEYGAALTNGRRPVDLDALMAGERRLEPLPSAGPRRWVRPVVLVAAAVAVVVLVGGFVIARAALRSSPDVGLVVPAVPGDPAALQDLRRAADATRRADSFTVTVTTPSGEGSYVYQAPDRVRQTLDGPSGPPATIVTGPLTEPGVSPPDGVTLPTVTIPDPARPSSSSIEQLTIDTTTYQRDPTGGWYSQAVPTGGVSGADIADGSFADVRAATSATRTSDGYHWTGDHEDGTAVVRDGFLVEVSVHHPAGPTYSDTSGQPTGTSPDFTVTIRITDIDTSPPVETPPADQVHPTPATATCTPPASTAIPCDEVPFSTRQPATSTTAAAPTTTFAAGPAPAGDIQFRPVLQTLLPAGAVPPQADAGGTELPGTEPGERYLVGPMLADGSTIESARAARDQGGRWTVGLVLRAGPDGIDQFNDAARRCHDDPTVCPTGQLAIVVDGQVISAPRIEPDQATFRPFDRDQIQISGNFDEAGANALAARLQR